MYKPKREQMNFYDVVYETTVPQKHFLRKLDKVLDWESFEPQLTDLYHDTGRHAHNPVIMFKAIVLQFLYDLSDRKLQEQITGFMPFRWSGPGPARISAGLFGLLPLPGSSGRGQNRRAV